MLLYLFNSFDVFKKILASFENQSINISTNIFFPQTLSFNAMLA
jgi:hypothetical protein